MHIKKNNKKQGKLTKCMGWDSSERPPVLFKVQNGIYSRLLCSKDLLLDTSSKINF
jgi:hypothetical protein